MKKRPDSELLQKNGGIIRPKEFFFETFWANSSGGFEGLETFFFFEKELSFLSFRFISMSFLFLLIP